MLKHILLVIAILFTACNNDKLVETQTICSDKVEVYDVKWSGKHRRVKAHFPYDNGFITVEKRCRRCTIKERVGDIISHCIHILTYQRDDSSKYVVLDTSL